MADGSRLVGAMQAKVLTTDEARRIDIKHRAAARAA